MTFYLWSDGKYYDCQESEKDNYPGEPTCYDYLLDWNSVNLDGGGTVSSSTGTVGITITTPMNADGDQWAMGTIDCGAELVSSAVDEPTIVSVAFDATVENVTFELYDIDSDNCTWDDRVTVRAYDANGAVVPVVFSDLAAHHHVNGTQIDTTGYVDPGVDGAGAADSVTVSIAGPIVRLEIIHDNGASASESGTVGVGDLCFDVAGPVGDGIVQGTGDGDLIDIAYTGDPEGDQIDNADALLPGETGDDDIVLAGDGDDTVEAGAGDDEVYGGAGSDTLSGGAGDDVLIGDATGPYGPGAAGATETQEVFKWSELDDKCGGHLSDGEKIVSQSQDTGQNTVTLTLATDYDNTFSTDPQIVDSIDTGDLPGANPYSSLESDLDCKGESQSYTLSFAKDASNISFRINDIDNDSTVVVTAFDAVGNPIAVDMEAGYKVTLKDVDGIDGYETAVSEGGNGSDTSSEYSALVSIPGPVAKIIITHTQDGYADSQVNITDIYFDTLASTGPGMPGDDVIDGGEGDDYIEGNQGDDYLTGGAGADEIYGGDDRDLIVGGAGDTVDGGAGGEDWDVLDLTGAGPFYLEGVTPDSNGNGFNGTVIFVDNDGNPSGETLAFSEIEEILGDELNRAPVAKDDVATTEEDSPVVIDVLGNDSDPDGDPLQVTEATSPDGTVVIEADGTLSFTPDANFNGETTITYTVADPDGATDTATVTVTVAPVNDAPVANDDSDTTEYNTPVTVDLLANDSDVDGDALAVTATNLVSGAGSIVDNGDGTVTFTPAPGFTGEAVINYMISDGNGGEDSAQHTITVGEAPLDGTVQGTAGDDIIDESYLGDPEGDRVDNEDAIIPGDGLNDDEIYGFDGNDSITAGLGDDRIYGGADDDTVDAGEGDDLVSGDEGNDTLDGGAGDDEIRGGDGDDRIIGGDGNDVAYGGDGNDEMDDVRGSKIDNGGSDTYYGGAGDDEMYTGLGDDDLYGGSGNDIVRGEGGNDLVSGGEGDDTISGGTGEDTLLAGLGNDTAYGGNDDDFIDASTGVLADSRPDVGYPGLYASDTDPADDLDTVYGGGGSDTIITGDDDDTIFGGSGNDSIDAGVDDDYVEAGSGSDTVIGSEGNDEVYGGLGDDLIYGGLDDSVPDLVNFPDDGSGPFGPDLVTDNNNDTLFGDEGNDTIFGADDDDTLYGGTGKDVLDGGVDDDTLFGDDGDDTLIGGQGADEMFGGLGNDIFLGGNGGDDATGGEDPDGNDWDVLDLTGSNVDFITYDETDPTFDPVSGVGESGVVTFLDGSTMTFSEIENVIPCFTPGTTIATPRGERLVEELREGDRIITRDNGIQEIRWVGRKQLAGTQLVRNPHLKPILVKAGALGNGLPERDMMVSPNHRVLVASDKTQLYFEEREVLAAAKHMVGAEGIHAVDVLQTTYIHFMFDRHEVVLSNGAWTESFQPGDYSLKGIGNSQRNEIFELFPELATKPGLQGYQAARRALKKHEAKLLMK